MLMELYGSFSELMVLYTSWELCQHFEEGEE